MDKRILREQFLAWAKEWERNHPNEVGWVGAHPVNISEPLVELIATGQVVQVGTENGAALHRVKQPA